MKKKFMIAVCTLFLVMGCSMTFAGEKAPLKVVDLAHSTLVAMGTDPMIIAAVKAENAKAKTLEQIKEMDEKWKTTPGIANYMQAIMDSECGKHIKKIQASAPYYAEIFVMDNQGANVAMTDKTSDYWQGDEAKFKESYKGGSGAIHISDVEFDDSSQAYLVQVSVPVKDGDQIIGAITIGVDVDKIQ